MGRLRWVHAAVQVRVSPDGGIADGCSAGGGLRQWSCPSCAPGAESCAEVRCSDVANYQLVGSFEVAVQGAGQAAQGELARLPRCPPGDPGAESGSRTAAA